MFGCSPLLSGAYTRLDRPIPEAYRSEATIRSLAALESAAAAGIKQGDIITKVGDVAVTSYTDLAGQVRAYAAGSKVVITYYRGGTAHETSVTLGKAKV